MAQGARGGRHLRVLKRLPTHSGRSASPGDEHDVRIVSYLLFLLDTWVITKHLQSQLDASALNRFRRDEQSRIAMVGRQFTASTQLVGPHELVAPASHELEEAVMLVTDKYVRLRQEETAAPKRVRGEFIWCPRVPTIRSRLRSNHVACSYRFGCRPFGRPLPNQGECCCIQSPIQGPY
ncbi:hypothetical protein PanWU01x14_205610, partial [Parasponia andersonii]